MSDYPYDPNTKYNADESYRIVGSVINGISQNILALQKQVRELKEADEKQELADLRIRDKNPAVKDAWDQYQTVLNLSRNR